MEYPGNYAEDLSAVLQGIIESDQEPPGTFAATPAEIRQVLDGLFYSSLLQEEGRSIRLSVVLIAHDHLPSAASSLLFQDPLPLTTDNLQKLAPMLDPVNASFIVTRCDTGLCIVGIEQELPQQSLYDQGLQDNPRFRVMALLPGVLTAEIFGDRVMLFSAGKAEHGRILEAELFTFEKLKSCLSAMSAEPLGAAATGPATLEDLTPLRASKARPSKPPDLRQKALSEEERNEACLALREIARLMGLKAHGGIVLVSPERHRRLLVPNQGYAAHASHRTLLSEAIYKYTRSFLSKGGIRDGEIGRVVSLDLIKELEQLRRATDFAAHLTLVDGALVLTPDLSISHIGAIIGGDDQLDSSTDAVLHTNPITGKTTNGLKNVGTRHLSALRFCRAQPGPALAMVASQDGAVSLVVKAKEEAEVIGPVFFRER